MKVLSNVVGIDQAIAQTGVAIYTPCREGEVFIDCFKTSSKDNVGTRLYQLETYLETLILKLDSPIICYEYVYCKRFVPYTSLKVLGIVEKLIAEYNLESYCFRSQAREEGSWRNILNLTSSKKDLQNKLGLKYNHNITDAIGILGSGLIKSDRISLDDFFKLKVSKLDATFRSSFTFL